MPWGAAAAAAATIGGAIISGNSARSAAETSAAAQRDAAAQAAEAARFKPYGVTTGFGTSTFGDQTASYTLTPELQAIRDRMLSQAGAYDTTRIGKLAQPLEGGATSLFNLGQQYLATSPEQAAQDWYRQQQGLLAGGREQELAGLRNQQFQTGRIGLGTGGTSTGMMQTNPEFAALYNARAQQDKTLAAQADQYGQQRTQFGAGLFGTGANLLSQVPSLTTQGYGPLQTQLGLAGQIEGYGQQALDIGAQLGGRSATAGARVADALLTGGTNAARTAQAGQSYNPYGAVLQGVGSNQALNSWFQNRLNQPSSTSNWSNPYQYNTAYTDQGATGGAYGVGTGGFE
jgi:hypothetical protein